MYNACCQTVCRANDATIKFRLSEISNDVSGGDLAPTPMPELLEAFRADIRDRTGIYRDGMISDNGFIVVVVVYSYCMHSN